MLSLIVKGLLLSTPRKGTLVADAADSTPFVSNGDTSTTITTVNPSDNDNIFFLGLNITAVATVSNGVPDTASTAALMALGLGALGYASLRKRRA